MLIFVEFGKMNRLATVCMRTATVLKSNCQDYHLGALFIHMHTNEDFKGAWNAMYASGGEFTENIDKAVREEELLSLCQMQ